MNQVHWLSYIEIFRWKFMGFWQDIIKNTASCNQGEYEFKVVNKFKQWHCFGWSFIIIMDSINIFFDYNKWIIHWHKKLFKNIHLLYSFKPSISADILKFVLQGFWALQEYFVFEAVFTSNLQIKKIWDLLKISHQISSTLLSTRGYYNQIQTTKGTICVKCFWFTLSTCADYPWFLPATAPAWS